MPNYQLLAVGTDIEVFLRDHKTDKPVPVCGLLGGTKLEPRPVPSLGNGFCVQEDNVMAEFNIPACNDPGQFSAYLEMMKEYLRRHFEEKGLYLDISPSMQFELAQLQTLQAQTFGCEPDFNVWELEENEIDTSNPALKRLRTAGGHVHVSFTVDGAMPTTEECFPVVKVLDLFLGVPSVLADKDAKRRQFYGKAGAFRLKQYAPNVSGVEYRTLSNFWFASPWSQRQVYTNVHYALRWLSTHSSPEERLDQYGPCIKNVINSLDDVDCNYLMEKFPISPLAEPSPTEKKKRPRLVFASPTEQEDWSIGLEPLTTGFTIHDDVDGPELQTGTDQI